MTRLTHLYGPAARCKLNLQNSWLVLRFCIRPLCGAERSWPLWISARVQTQPSSKITAACEGRAIANRSDDSARDDRADARYCHQIQTKLRVLGEHFDFSAHSLDAIVEMAPVLKPDPLGCEPSAVTGHLCVGRECPAKYGATSGAVASP